MFTTKPVIFKPVFILVERLNVPDPSRPHPPSRGQQQEHPGRPRPRNQVLPPTRQQNQLRHSSKTKIKAYSGKGWTTFEIFPYYGYFRQAALHPVIVYTVTMFPFILV